MTLVELLVAAGVGSVVLAMTVFLFMIGIRSIAGLGNYSTLSAQSRLALDTMSREIREATQITAATTNLPIRSLVLTNAFQNKTITFSWDSTTGVLTYSKTGQPTRTNLAGCDQWTFSMFQRTPTNNWTFYPASDKSLCKLIQMSWKCSRTILGKKINTEEVMTAEVVLRNKQ